jgi:hypothetical protein
MRFRQQVQDLARTAAVRSLQPGTLIELPGGVWVGVGRGVDAAIFVVRDPDFVMTATAAEPLSDAVGLRLRNGLILPRSATEPTVLAFADGILRLGGLDQAVTSGARERDLVALWRNRAAVDYAVEMQQRLALSASLLLAPFGGFLIAPRRARSGRVSALLVSLTALAGYYAAFTFGKQAALKGWLPVAPALWAANVAAALLMTWAMVRRHRRAGLP